MTGRKGHGSTTGAWLADDGAGGDPDDDGRHSLLIRRNNTTGALAFYRCWTPGPVTLALALAALATCAADARALSDTGHQK
ncbi:hypothetical protein [Actinoplanes sp. M2I2]|uniref:hypothetical protein n=1 Tax=Actinoplanes sp. M2I2 TaxID=1734444 RepID=UPI002021D973|nr:hypothetical protein [Actinoplanes sp. M2I2]